MEIAEHIGQQGRTYYLKGRFDAHQAPKLKARLASAGDGLVLDFSDVTFIDSTGLALLVSVHKQSQKDNFSFKIVNIQDQVRVIFEITQLHNILPLETA